MVVVNVDEVVEVDEPLLPLPLDEVEDKMEDEVEAEEVKDGDAADDDEWVVDFDWLDDDAPLLPLDVDDDNAEEEEKEEDPPPDAVDDEEEEDEPYRATCKAPFNLLASSCTLLRAVLMFAFACRTALFESSPCITPPVPLGPLSFSSPSAPTSGIQLPPPPPPAPTRACAAAARACAATASWPLKTARVAANAPAALPSAAAAA